MTTKRIEILQAQAIFGGITAHALEFLLQRSSEYHIAKDDYFFHEGDNAESLFVLEKGKADLFKQHGDQLFFLRQMQQGDCFGEVAIIDLMPRSATVRANTDCCSIELTRTALFELYQADLEQFTIIQMNMAREVSRRLRKADERLFNTVQANNKLTIPQGNDSFKV